MFQSFWLIFKKIDDLDVCKLKTVPIDLKKLSDAGYNQVVNNTKFKTLKTNVNNLEKKIREATSLIHANNTTQINKI